MGTGAPSWVVCEGATRPVIDAIVDCPLRGRVIAIECLGCRLLVTSSAERSRRGWCVAELDAADAAGSEVGSAPHREDERAAAPLG